jgi:hypothetical protein
LFQFELEVSGLRQIFVISKKENHTLGYGFKNLKKIKSLAIGFLLFVIAISGDLKKKSVNQKP